MKKEYKHFSPLEDCEVHSEFYKLFSNPYNDLFFRWGIKKMTPKMNKKERLEAIDKFISASDKKEIHQATCQMIYGMIQSSVDKNGFTINGVENVDSSKPHLYIMTHQNIWADPFFTNYAIMKEGFDATEIVLGNNMVDFPLLGFKTNFMEVIMKGLNCAIVNRNRGYERSLVNFSHYVHESMAEGNSMLCASQSGRSKNGEINMDISVLKMFYRAVKNKMSINEFVETYHIIPINISYEIEPNAEHFAKEIIGGDNYKKSKFEDIKTAAKGITGQKGNVEVRFNEEIKGDFGSLEEVADAISSSLISNHAVHETNRIAYNLKQKTFLIETNKGATFYDKELTNKDRRIREQIINFYARPVEQQEESRG